MSRIIDQQLYSYFTFGKWSQFEGDPEPWLWTSPDQEEQFYSLEEAKEALELLQGEPGGGFFEDAFVVRANIIETFYSVEGDEEESIRS